MTTTSLEDDRKEILGLQKEFMNAIMEYMIKHGAGTVQWNVSVQFIEFPKVRK